MVMDALDSLYTRVAKKILTETLHLRKGESVTVETWDNGLPFARRAVAEARALGCPAVMIYEDEAAYVEGVRRAPDEVVGEMGKNEFGLLSGSDAYVFIPGQALGVYSKTLKPEERERSTRYNSSWYDAAEKAGLRGARLSFGYAGRDMARFLGRPIKEIVRAQLKGALADYRKISGSAQKVSPLLGDGAEAELISGKTALRFSLRGELAVEDGIVDEQDMKTGNNMTYVPPGLLTKEVDPATVSGSVTLTDSLTKYGVIHMAELNFKDGRMTGWDSDDRSTLKRLLDGLPSEKRRVSILGVGFNPALRYGWGADRFVSGSVTLSGFGFTGVVRGGSLKVGGSVVLEGGRRQI